MNWQSDRSLDPRHLHNIEKCGSSPSGHDQFHLLCSEKTWSILRPLTEFKFLVIQSTGICLHRTGAAVGLGMKAVEEGKLTVINAPPQQTQIINKNGFLIKLKIF